MAYIRWVESPERVAEGERVHPSPRNVGAKACHQSLLRETNLTAVAKYGPGRQIDFTDVCYVARRPGKFAGATGNVDGISDDREKSLRDWSGGRNRRVEGEHISRLRHPVMLDMKHYRARNQLGRSEQSSTYSASQVSCGNAHRGV